MTAAAAKPPAHEIAAGTPPASQHAVLSGWGRYPSADSDVFRPEKRSELAAVVAANSTPLIARGAGRAYGDAAINAGGRIARVERLNRMLAFDSASAILRAEAGVTIAEIIDVFLARGFFPPVTPGTRFVTLGGSIAADVHGKNHHRDSSLASHVLSFDLLLASGETRHCSREENAELFWATVGGMGLTGVILEVELRLRPIESAWLQGQLIRAANVDEAFDAFERTDCDYGYSVAWVDCTSRGAALGRSVLNVGNFATRDSLPKRVAQEPFRTPPRIRGAVPLNLPHFILNAFSIRAFNRLIWAAQRSSHGSTLFDYDSFFYPLDSISNWNRAYGLRGFVQYQCVWPPDESRAGLIEVLEAVAKSRHASFVTVLKKFGAQDGMLSFPMPGYTLALDFPVTDGLFEFLDGLDEMVLKRGGRVYLAKDARMKPAAFRAMYPNFTKWQWAKAAADPNNRFSSSLSRRLQMDPA